MNGFLVLKYESLEQLERLIESERRALRTAERQRRSVLYSEDDTDDYRQRRIEQCRARLSELTTEAAAARAAIAALSQQNRKYAKGPRKKRRSRKLESEIKKRWNLSRLEPHLRAAHIYSELRGGIYEVSLKTIREIIRDLGLKKTNP